MKPYGESKPNILITIRNLDIGGAQTYSLELARSLKSLGARIYILTLSKDGYMSNEFAKIGKTLPPPSFSRIDGTPIFPKILKHIEFKYVISNLYVGDLLAYHLRYLGKSFFWVSIKHMLVSRVNESMSVDENFDSYAANRIVERQLVSDCDLTIAVSNHVKDSLVERNCKKKNIVVKRILSAKPVQSYTKRSHTGVLLGTLSRLHYDKGIDFLIRALHYFREANNWRLVIASDGPEKENLKKLVQLMNLSNRIDFIGVVPNSLEFLSSLDCLVLPSRTEGFPVVIQEALAVGTPIVASNVGGIKELNLSIMLQKVTPGSIKSLISTLQPYIEGEREFSAITASVDINDFGSNMRDLAKYILTRARRKYGKGN